MSAFDIKDRLGIEGTEAWLVAADHFDELLDLVYVNHRGEIWLFNNDLRVFKDHDLFEQIYAETIVGKLGQNIAAVKVLVNNDAENFVFPEPTGVVKDELRFLYNYAAERQLPVPPLLFGRCREALTQKVVAEVIGDAPLNTAHSWIFYVHGGSLSKRDQNGLVLLRPSEFPFLAKRETIHALSWHLSDTRIITKPYKDAFNACFAIPGVFRLLTEELKLIEVPSIPRPYDLPRGIAFGESPDVLVITPAVDELQHLKDLLSDRLRKVPFPQRGDRHLACFRTLTGRKNVVLASVGEGNIDASLQTAHLLTVFHPTKVILFGIAGGYPHKGRHRCRIGDVAVGEAVIHYERGDVIKDRSGNTGVKWVFKRKGNAKIAWSLSDDIVLYKKASELLLRWPVDGTPMAEDVPVGAARDVKAYLATIGSGGKIVESHDFITSVIHEANLDITVLETEAAGVCHACTIHGVSEWLIVRGIMDFCDEELRKDGTRALFRTYAGKSCARFVLDLLETL